MVIWRASIFETDLVDNGYRDLKWGIIAEVFPSGKFLVNCRGGLLVVHEFECTTGIERGKLLESPIEIDNFFELNEHGYHDLVGDYE